MKKNMDLYTEEGEMICYCNYGPCVVCTHSFMAQLVSIFLVAGQMLWTPLYNLPPLYNYPAT